MLGAIVGTGGLVLLVDAISQAPQYGWGATRTIAVLAASAALLVVFLGIESRVDSPILPLLDLPPAHAVSREHRWAVAGRQLLCFRVRRDPVHAGGPALQRAADRRRVAGSVCHIARLAGLSQWLVTRSGAKVVMVIGMTLIGAGIIWATQVPVDGHFLSNLAGPFVVAGMGTAFSFIPISVAALEGVTEHQSGLASGLLNTSTQVGAAIGTAIASSVAANGTKTLLRAGDALPTALTGGFHQTFWVLGAIALIAPPAVFALTRRPRRSNSVVDSGSREGQHALAATK